MKSFNHFIEEAAAKRCQLENIGALVIKCKRTQISHWDGGYLEKDEEESSENGNGNGGNGNGGNGNGGNGGNGGGGE